jgi:uncharacterized protein YabE (DUF348 family)
MKMIYGLALIFAIFLSACQPAAPPSVTLLDNGQVTTLQTEERVPSSLLAQAGISLNPNDRILVNGSPVALNQPITGYSITIQIRRATTLSLVTPDGEQKIQSSAFTIGEAALTVGEALAEAGIPLLGLDYSMPAEKEPLPSNGQIRIVRVSESVCLRKSPSLLRAISRPLPKSRSTRRRSSSPAKRDWPWSASASATRTARKSRA